MSVTACNKVIPLYHFASNPYSKFINSDILNKLTSIGRPSTSDLIQMLIPLIIYKSGMRFSTTSPCINGPTINQLHSMGLLVLPTIVPPMTVLTSRGDSRCATPVQAIVFGSLHPVRVEPTSNKDIITGTLPLAEITFPKGVWFSDTILVVPIHL
jgi:hypothetical protein